jgi:signal transduction histidine kinase
MHDISKLASLRQPFINRALHNLSRGTSIRDDLRSQLEQFFDQMVQAVESGDPAWLDNLLLDWAAAQTQTELESETSGLSSLIKQLMLVHVGVCRDNLSESEALDTIELLLPIYTYAFERAAQHEISSRVNYITNKLNATWQSLQRLDESKSRFVSIAAHELKTPLTLVEGYTAMLKDTIERRSGSPDEVILISGIHSGAKRLQHIIDDMITVSLIDNNLLNLHFQPTWLNRLFVALEDDIRASILERHQTFEIIPFEGMDEMNYADSERMLQVFKNVVYNAIKFTPDGGRITLSGRKLPGFIEVLFTDNGIGIDPDVQVFIFNTFSLQGDVALHSSGRTKFKGGGPGLGLHIAKGIVEAHGGTIWVESPGCDEKACPGSIFHILIPFRNEPPDKKMQQIFAPLHQKPVEKEILSND